MKVVKVYKMLYDKGVVILVLLLELICYKSVCCNGVLLYIYFGCSMGVCIWFDSCWDICYCWGYMVCLFYRIYIGVDNCG